MEGEVGVGGGPVGKTNNQSERGFERNGLMNFMGQVDKLAERMGGNAFFFRSDKWRQGGLVSSGEMFTWTLKSFTAALATP